MKAMAAAGRLRRARGFIAGVAVGVLLLIVGRYVVNKSSTPDWLVQPLLTTDTPGQADAIVGLGAGVTSECFPNQHGVTRVLLAARLWREKRAPVIVFTGGNGGGPCSIAESMRRLAEEIGVPRSSIRLEEASSNTWENGQLTAPILRERGAQRVLLVTDRLHMKRSAAVFAQFGFAVERASVPLYESYRDNVEMLFAGGRELAALMYYRARGWGVPVARAESRIEPQTPPGVQPMQNLKHPNGPIVVLGASYARGWDLKSIGPVPLVNKGVDGQQSWEMLARFESDVLAQAPRAVVLWGFINDIFRASDTSAALTRARASYERMIVLARANGVEPILATEVTVTTPDSWRETLSSWVGWLRGKESYQAGVNRHVMAMNEWLVQLARREGLQLLDFQATLAGAGGERRREFAQPDGSHISVSGYAAITAYARPILEKHAERR